MPAPIQRTKQRARAPLQMNLRPAAQRGSNGTDSLDVPELSAKLSMRSAKTAIPRHKPNACARSANGASQQSRRCGVRNRVGASRQGWTALLKKSATQASIAGPTDTFRACLREAVDKAGKEKVTGDAYEA